MNDQAAPPNGGAWVRRLLDTSPSGAVITDRDGLTLFRNARFNELMRIPADITDPIDVRRFIFDRPDQLRLRGLLADGSYDKSEFRFRAFDGSAVWTILTLDRVSYGGQEAILSWLFDITERKGVEDALRQSQARLDLAISGTNSAVWEADLVSGNRWWSPQFFRMLGYRDETEPERPKEVWEDSLHPEDRQRVLNSLRAHADGATDVYNEAYRMIRCDGSEFWVEAKGRITRDAQGRPATFNGIMSDITDRRMAEAAVLRAKEDAEKALGELRRTQEELIQAEKMAALGSLVAGVAHEINTPLGNTLTAASHLADQNKDLTAVLAEGKMRRSDLNQFIGLVGETTTLMLANLERAVELVQSFKQVAVDQTSGERRQFDLKGYIDEVLLSLRPRLRKTRHQVEVDCPRDIIVDGYPGALSQILTNFVLNSLLHAFGDDVSGHLAISVSQPDPDWIELSYSDDGVGMSGELLGRVFDPFFTTRRGSGGSGLGLHIVFNLVTVSLGGNTSVQSEPGAGTRFLVRFPRSAPVEAGNDSGDHGSVADDRIQSYAGADGVDVASVKQR